MQLTDKFIFYLIVFQSLILFTDRNCASAQVSGLYETKKELDKVYGVDYTLVNGMKYVNFYASASGHPFLNTPDFETGWLKIKGKLYENQIINYDVYNQEVIAEYRSELIGSQRYIVPGIFLEAFGMGQREFIKLKVADRKPAFYELISNQKDSLLLIHEKMYTINRSSGGQGFLFSETITKKYLLKQDELIRFKNNRSFRKLFSTEIRGDIKSWMKKHRINVRKADPALLKQMMNYVNTL